MDSANRNRRLIVYPLLFALFPIISILSANMSEIESVAAVKPAVFSIITAALVFLALSLAFRNAHKGALATSLLLVLFFSYGHVCNILGNSDASLINGIALSILGVWGLFGVFGMIGITRTKRDLSSASQVLNAVAIFMLITPAITIGQYELTENNANPVPARPEKQIAPKVAISEAIEKPDIYYLVFDRYSSARELKRVVDFDNGRFIDDLKKRGLYVADRSRTNYSRTYLSLSSSLNMKYHDRYFDRRVSLGPLQDSRVARILKGQGYKYVHYESRYPPTRNNPLADINIATSKRKIDSFSRLVLDTTLARPVLTESYPLEREEQILFELESLIEAPKIPGPKFVFAHLIIPHEPYLFDKDGRRVSAEDLNRKPEIELYKDYILFANIKILEIIDALVADSKPPPIIVIQADEGFRSKPQWRKENPLARELHFGILNAYYLPGVDANKVLYDSITPVNSFRVIFNAYFQTDFEILPDENFLAPPNKNVHSFKRVTDSLKN